ncbi:MAG: sulfotransferase family 2 domain-containing protein [Rhodobacteraceae bacterium]|nr:sulfotransferase family 2 domain-containing protein [Paracoccaceae bacterium]
MPIIRTGRGIVYFAHVPKCAGTAIEGYMTRRFGQRARAFLNPAHYARPDLDRWSRSSPQHIDAENLMALFPPIFFDAMFTMVRHPVARLRSVYLHHRDTEDGIAAGESFADWLRALPERRAANPFYLDNHARAMTDIVPQGATVFRLEEGTQGVVDWLDALTGNTNGPRAIPVRHTYSDRLSAAGKAPQGALDAPTAQEIAQIAEIYEADFDRFGYPHDPAEMADGLRPVAVTPDDPKRQ